MIGTTNGNLLAPHLDGYRRIWMFPRNIRRIYPWKMSQILTLLLQQLRFGQWSGNQKLQDAFCKALEKSKLKTKGVQYDPNSGGPRTYLSQLKCLGLIFERPDRTIMLTKAGEDLSKGNPPLPILQAILLEHQYPSIYAKLSNVKINPYLKVKPFLFVLELLKHKDIGYLTGDELIIPVIYGHNRKCLDLCIEKIIKLRSGVAIDELIDNDEDLYLPRSRNSSRKAILGNIRDIANTYKNYLQACCLINVDQINGHQLITFNFEFEDIYQKHLAKADKFIALSDNEESFQRSYGAWDRIKDTRRLEAPFNDSVSPEAGIILSLFYSKCGENIISEMPEDFVSEISGNYGFPKDQIREIIEPHLKTALDFFESTFIAQSTGGIATATDFEEAICNLFRDKLYFNAKRTGQIRRGRGEGFADIFAIALDNCHCAIIDAKASPRYTLPAKDIRAMTYDYIPNYMLLSEGEPLHLEFATFIAGGYSGNINTGLKKIKKESMVECSAISARDFLNIAKKQPSKENQLNIRKIFMQSKKLTIEDIIV